RHQHRARPTPRRTPLRPLLLHRLHLDPGTPYVTRRRDPGDPGTPYETRRTRPVRLSRPLRRQRGRTRSFVWCPRNYFGRGPQEGSEAPPFSEVTWRWLEPSGWVIQIWRLPVRVEEKSR